MSEGELVNHELGDLEEQISRVRIKTWMFTYKQDRHLGWISNCAKPWCWANGPTKRAAYDALHIELQRKAAEVSKAVQALLAEPRPDDEEPATLAAITMEDL